MALECCSKRCDAGNSTDTLGSSATQVTEPFGRLQRALCQLDLEAEASRIGSQEEGRERVKTLHQNMKDKKKKMTYQSQTEQPTNLGRLTSNQVFLPLKSLGDPGSSNKPSELPRRSRQKAVAWDPNEQTALACRSSGTSLSSQHGLRGRVRVSRTVSVWTPGENAGAPVPKGSEAPKTPGGPKLQTPDCAPSSDGTCGYPESTDSEAFRPRPCGMRLTWWHDDRLKNSGFHTK